MVFGTATPDKFKSIEEKGAGRAQGKKKLNIGKVLILIQRNSIL
ncbi:FtsK/SpoIIIE family protein [Streptococcus pneumoniae]|nr:FtsK/SpoIIIE family protein [Streptococcus pneumoniae]